MRLEDVLRAPSPRAADRLNLHVFALDAEGFNARDGRSGHLWGDRLAVELEPPTRSQARRGR